MDRRKSLKVIALGSLSAGVLLEACKGTGKKTTPPGPDTFKGSVDSVMPAGRMQEEKDHVEKINAETFFTPHEIATITRLADIIIPRDDVSGSASDAGVPDFIEFMVKDKPEFKLPMRGGIHWLDLQCYKRFGNPFVKCKSKQQLELIDQIAFPDKVSEAMKQGAAFFSLVRNLTASGFYTSPIGVKDIGYMGNTPNAWNGVPDAVLAQYRLAYTEQELKECASYPD